MSFRDAAAGGRTFVSDSSASADRRMVGAFARIVSQGIAFNARSHGMPMSLSLVDGGGVFTHYVNKPLGPTNLTPTRKLASLNHPNVTQIGSRASGNPRGDSAIQ